MRSLDIGKVTMNVCIKTGADVYLPDRNSIVHGDLYKVGDIYIFKSTGSEKDIQSGDRYHLRMENYYNCGEKCIAAHEDECCDFLYEGWVFYN